VCRVAAKLAQVCHCEFVDQAALHGVLATIRDLNLPLIGVRLAQDPPQVEPATGHQSQAHFEGGADAQ